MASSLLCCAAPEPAAAPGAELLALYLLPRPRSVARALQHVPGAGRALDGLVAAGLWGGLAHVELTSFSAAPRHVRALPVAGRSAAAAGTAAASRHEPWNIGAGKWARKEGKGGGDVWEIALWSRVLAAVVRAIAKADGVVGARRQNIVKPGKGRLHLDFGPEGKTVENADMSRFLAILDWDLALVSRRGEDECGRDLVVKERCPVGPEDGATLPGQSYAKMT